MSILLIGSSHIYWHERFVQDNKVQDYRRPDCPHVHYIGIRGGRITNSNRTRRLEHHISVIRPRHLLIHIGGNDLDEVESDYQLIISRLLLFCNHCIAQYGITSVRVFQLMPRRVTRNLPVETYNMKVSEANTYLKQSKDILLETARFTAGSICVARWCTNLSERGQLIFMRNKIIYR